MNLVICISLRACVGQLQTAAHAFATENCKFILNNLLYVHTYDSIEWFEVIHRRLFIPRPYDRYVVMKLKVRTWENIQQWSRLLRYRHDVAADTIVGCWIFHPVRFQF